MKVDGEKMTPIFTVDNVDALNILIHRQQLTQKTDKEKKIIPQLLYRDYEFETFLTIKYDEHGQVMGTHDPNQKKRKGGGWTTTFTRVSKRKK